MVVVWQCCKANDSLRHLFLEIFFPASGWMKTYLISESLHKLVYTRPHPTGLEIRQRLFMGFDEPWFISNMDLVLPILRPGETLAFQVQR